MKMYLDKCIILNRSSIPNAVNVTWELCNTSIKKISCTSYTDCMCILYNLWSGLLCFVHQYHHVHTLWQLVCPAIMGFFCRPVSFYSYTVVSVVYYPLLTGMLLFRHHTIICLIGYYSVAVQNHSHKPQMIDTRKKGQRNTEGPDCQVKMGTTTIYKKTSCVGIMCFTVQLSRCWEGTISRAE